MSRPDLRGVFRTNNRSLASVDVFDVYRGPPVPDGRTSVDLHLVFQSSDRTLTDAEADTARSRIVAALASELGGELRE